MPFGAGASGQTDAAYGREVGSQPVVLLGRLVDSRLPAPALHRTQDGVPQVQVGFEPESVFATHYPSVPACPGRTVQGGTVQAKIHAPTKQPRRVQHGRRRKSK
jgi:hypothetical protein